LGELVSFNSNSIHKLGDTVGESVFGLFSASDASASGGESIHTDKCGEGVDEPISPMDKSFHADTSSSGDSEGTTAGRLSVEYTLSGSSPSHGHNAQVDHVPDDDDEHPWEAAKSVKSSETLSGSLHEGNGIEQEPSHDIPPQEGGASSCVSSSEVAGSTHSSSHYLHDPLHNGLERPDEQSKADLVLMSRSTSAAEVNIQRHGNREKGNTEPERVASDRDGEGLALLESESMSEGGKPVEGTVPVEDVDRSGDEGKRWWEGDVDQGSMDEGISEHGTEEVEEPESLRLPHEFAEYGG